MHVLITGGTGFIGQYMTKRYLSMGETVTIIGRSEQKIKRIFGNQVHALSWASFSKMDAAYLKQFDLIINLSGAGIADMRWTKQRQHKLIDSRIKTTHTIATHCAKLGKSSPPWFNASAIGIYPPQTITNDHPPHVYNETSPLSPNPALFSCRLVTLWENATKLASDFGVRVVRLRFAVVLGKNGGMLTKLKWPYLLGLGGKIGNGKQPLPWISLLDLCCAIDFIFSHQHITGAVNLISPEYTNQQQFAKTLGKTLHRPTLLNMPAFMMKIAYGQLANELLLAGQSAEPRALLSHGFSFKIPSLIDALHQSF